VFVALVVQHALRVRHIFICFLSGSTLFIYIAPTRHDLFFKKVTEYKTRVLIFSTPLLILRRNEMGYDKKCAHVFI
jgi:hypothetical protein